MTWSAPIDEELEVVSRGGADDARARRLGDLHRGRTDAAGGAMDQHGLAARDAARFVQRAIRGFGGDRYAGRFLEGHGLRLARQAVHRDHGVFGITAALPREAQHRLADLPPVDALAQRVDDTGNIGAGNRPTRLPAFQSTGLTPAARTLMSTSPAPGFGTGISCTESAPPSPTCTACIFPGAAASQTQGARAQPGSTACSLLVYVQRLPARDETAGQEKSSA